MSAFRDDSWPSKQRTGQTSELHDTVHWSTSSLSPASVHFINDVNLVTSRVTRLRDISCMHGICIWPQRSDTAQQTQGIQPMLFQC